MISGVKLGKAYGPQPSDVVLRGANIHVPQGEFAALVGPSGSGKSTLLNIIGLLDAPDSGRLRIDGHSIENLDPAEAARLRNRLIGFVFQSFHLLARLTAWENAALPLLYRGAGRAERREKALAMLDRVGLSHRAGHRPDQMSGGQKQRVALARALIGEPKLILADEPTGNLDSETGAEVMTLLRTLNRDLGVTILMVTHDHEKAALCDRTIEIRDGQILVPGATP